MNPSLPEVGPPQPAVGHTHPPTRSGRHVGWRVAIFEWASWAGGRVGGLPDPDQNGGPIFLQQKQRANNVMNVVVGRQW